MRPIVLALAAVVLAAAAPAPWVPAKGYRASGNEPFWMVTVADGRLRLERPAFATRTLKIRSDVTDGTVRRVRAGSLDIRIERRLCRDSMSGMPRPDTVTFSLDGRAVDGCGGEPASLLEGPEWTVTRLGADDLGAAGLPQPVTIAFAGGRVAGSSGCNRFMGPYQLTGDGVRLGPLAGTRRACLGAGDAVEGRVLKHLAAVTHFDVRPDGSLELKVPDGTALVARR